MIRNLINHPVRHNVIFNINNGEEIGLFGTAAFMKHPWAKDVKAFINLGTFIVLANHVWSRLDSLPSLTPFFLLLKIATSFQRVPALAVALCSFAQATKLWPSSTAKSATLRTLMSLAMIFSSWASSKGNNPRSKLDLSTATLVNQEGTYD